MFATKEKIYQLEEILKAILNEMVTYAQQNEVCIDKLTTKLKSLLNEKLLKYGYHYTFMLEDDNPYLIAEVKAYLNKHKYVPLWISFKALLSLEKENNKLSETVRNIRSEYILTMDPLWIPERTKKYMVDIRWFGTKIHARVPQYRCHNFIEYFILGNDNEIIDDIQLYPPIVDGKMKLLGDYCVEVDEETYQKVKKYMRN